MNDDDDDADDDKGMSASRYPCMPSLVALQQMRNRLHLAHLGKKLMKWTAQATVRELRRISFDINAQYEGFEEEIRQAFILLARSRFYQPMLNGTVLENVPKAACLHITTTTRSVSGVKLFVLEVVETPGDPYSCLGLGQGGQTITETKVAWRNLLKKMIFISELRKSFTDVDIANKTATKRCNVIKRILIPKLKATIAYILSELDEREKEEISRIKQFKKLKNRKKKKEELLIKGKGDQFCSSCLTILKNDIEKQNKLCDICLSQRQGRGIKKKKIIEEVTKPCKLEETTKPCNLEEDKTDNSLEALTNQIDEAICLTRVITQEGLITECMDKLIEKCAICGAKEKIEEASNILSVCDACKQETPKSGKSVASGVLPICDACKQETMKSKDIKIPQIITPKSGKSVASRISSFCDYCKKKIMKLKEIEISQIITPKSGNSVTSRILPFCDACKQKIVESEEIEIPQIITPKSGKSFASVSSNKMVEELDSDVYNLGSKSATQFGYFEKKFEEVVKVTRLQNDDGTISEEKQVITIKTERRNPRNPGAECFGGGNDDLGLGGYDGDSKNNFRLPRNCKSDHASHSSTMGELKIRPCMSAGFQKSNQDASTSCNASNASNPFLAKSSNSCGLRKASSGNKTQVTRKTVDVTRSCIQPCTSTSSGPTCCKKLWIVKPTILAQEPVEPCSCHGDAVEPKKPEDKIAVGFKTIGTDALWRDVCSSTTELVNTEPSRLSNTNKETGKELIVKCNDFHTTCSNCCKASSESSPQPVEKPPPRLEKPVRCRLKIVPKAAEPESKDPPCCLHTPCSESSPPRDNVCSVKEKPKAEKTDQNICLRGSFLDILKILILPNECPKNTSAKVAFTAPDKPKVICKKCISKLSSFVANQDLDNQSVPSSTSSCKYCQASSETTEQDLSSRSCSVSTPDSTQSCSCKSLAVGASSEIKCCQPKSRSSSCSGMYGKKSLKSAEDSKDGSSRSSLENKFCESSTKQSICGGRAPDKHKKIHICCINKDKDEYSKAPSCCDLAAKLSGKSLKSGKSTKSPCFPSQQPKQSNHQLECCESRKSAIKPCCQSPCCQSQQPNQSNGLCESCKSRNSSKTTCCQSHQPSQSNGLCESCKSRNSSKTTCCQSHQPSQSNDLCESCKSRQSSKTTCCQSHQPNQSNDLCEYCKSRNSSKTTCCQSHQPSQSNDLCESCKSTQSSKTKCCQSHQPSQSNDLCESCKSTQSSKTKCCQSHQPSQSNDLCESCKSTQSSKTKCCQSHQPNQSNDLCESCKSRKSSKKSCCQSHQLNQSNDRCESCKSTKSSIITCCQSHQPNQSNDLCESCKSRKSSKTTCCQSHQPNQSNDLCESCRSTKSSIPTCCQSQQSNKSNEQCKYTYSESKKSSKTTCCQSQEPNQSNDKWECCIRWKLSKTTCCQSQQSKQSEYSESRKSAKTPCQSQQPNQSTDQWECCKSRMSSKPTCCQSQQSNKCDDQSYCFESKNSVKLPYCQSQQSKQPNDQSRYCNGEKSGKSLNCQLSCGTFLEPQQSSDQSVCCGKRDVATTTKRTDQYDVRPLKVIKSFSKKRSGKDKNVCACQSEPIIGSHTNTQHTNSFYKGSKSCQDNLELNFRW